MPVSNDASAPTGGGGWWTKEQLRNAAIIYAVGRAMGMTTRDIQIGLITAMTESNLINVNYGDRDSLGLFQQRPSQGWGTPAQVTDPQYAARKFFTALRGLGDRRYQMSMGAAAQAVQRSAYPDRYAERLTQMRQMWPALSKAGGGRPKDMDGNDFGSAPTPYYGGGAGPGFVPTAYMPPSIEAFVKSYQEQYGLLPTEDMLNAPSVTDMLGPASEADNLSLSDVMLGPWDLNAEQPYDPVSDGFGTPLSLGTNQIIRDMQDSTDGGYAKGVDGWRGAVIAAAKSALGTPYVWGGNSLQSGVDCSGLIQQAFAKAGFDLPRISFQQAQQGQRVGIKGLRPGDLVAWDNSPRNPGADHIAIYLGNGMIIEAARPGTLVRIRKLGANLEGGWGVHLNF